MQHVAGVVGGLSIVWTRLHVKDHTRIRNGPKFVKRVIGWDANSLYLHCQRSLPTGMQHNSLIIILIFLHNICDVIKLEPPCKQRPDGSKLADYDVIDLEPLCKQCQTVPNSQIMAPSFWNHYVNKTQTVATNFQTHF